VKPEEEMNGFGPLTVGVLLACALGLNACSSIRHHSSEAKYIGPPLSEQRLSSQNRAGLNGARVNLDFRLINLTGAPLTGVYLSPSASSGWEENILAGSDLKSGNTLKIRFNPNETAVMWDLRIEGADAQYAEWKNLNLGDTSQITLRLELSPRLTAVAEVE
jgi:uncharacterized protein YjbI with pentapeptide repeats